MKHQPTVKPPGFLRTSSVATVYDFWLTKLNQFSGNFQKAEMVKAFINSIEYRRRFGQPLAAAGSLVAHENLIFRADSL